MCCVLDEAHKALGNYAYSQVVRELVVNSVKFRVLALSATPGDDLTAIQEVSENTVFISCPIVPYFLKYFLTPLGRLILERLFCFITLG